MMPPEHEAFKQTSAWLREMLRLRGGLKCPACPHKLKPGEAKRISDTYCDHGQFSVRMQTKERHA